MKKLVFVVSPYSTTITSLKVEETEKKKSSRAAPLSFPLGVLNLSSTVKKTLNDYNDDNVELIDFNYLHDGPFHEKVLEDAFKNIIETVPKNNIKLIKGRVENTLLEEKNLPEKISILRLDTDWYESTKIELEVLYPRLMSGGFLIIEDYGHFKGFRKAVDEYFKDNMPYLHYVNYTCRLIIKR